MATRNRTVQFRKYRDAVKSVRAPLSSSAPGPVIEMVSTSPFRSNPPSYAPLSTEEPGPSTSRYFFSLFQFFPLLSPFYYFFFFLISFKAYNSPLYLRVYFNNNMHNKEYKSWSYSQLPLVEFV